MAAQAGQRRTLEWQHHLGPLRLVFIDETAVTIKMTRSRGRSPRGSRLETDAPVRHWRPQTFIAGLCMGQLTAPWVLDGPMSRAALDIYIETQLAPILQPGDVVIADNLSSHKSAKAKELLMAQGSWLLFSALQSRPQSSLSGHCCAIP